MRRTLILTTLLLAVGVVFYFWPSAVRPGGKPGATSTEESRPNLPRGPSGPGEASAPPAVRSPSPAPDIAAAVLALSPVQLEADFPIAAPLNAPDSNIARDLEIVRQLFENWQSNFPREGNPIGENAEITSALMGENRLGLALIPRGHRALNERGELCDRWGTPFRFHQVSGTQMEVRSAGPDRKFGTADDAQLTPP